jgi:thioredoxin 1
MYRKNIVITLIVSLLFSACNSQNSSVKNLDPGQFEAAIAKGDVQLIDVRTPDEYKEKHIGNARNINIDGSDFNSQIATLDKHKPVYFYCLAGGRSSKAATYAVNNGFTQVYNLEHGINSWMADNKPVVTATGSAPDQGMSFDDYLAHIKQPGKLTLVDFNAVWCGPCKALRPIVEKVVAKNKDKVDLWSIDIDKNPQIAKTMNITGIPLLILYRDGKELWRNLGLTDEKEITGQISKNTK